jgi:hypothetical protein
MIRPANPDDSYFFLGGGSHPPQASPIAVCIPIATYTAIHVLRPTLEANLRHVKSDVELYIGLICL